MWTLPGIVIDHHVLAEISIAGIVCDVLGGLDNLPARRLGAFGTILLLFGLVLQSIQYWIALFDMSVR